MSKRLVLLTIVAAAALLARAQSQTANPALSMKIRHTGSAAVLVFQNRGDVAIRIAAITLDNCVHVDQMTWGAKCGEPRTEEIVLPPQRSVSVPVLGSGGSPTFNVSYQVAADAATVSATSTPRAVLTDSGTVTDGTAYLYDMIFPQRQLLGSYTSTPDPSENPANNPVLNAASSGLLGSNAAQSAYAVQGLASILAPKQTPETITSYGYPIGDVQARSVQARSMGDAFSARIDGVLAGKSPGDANAMLRTALTQLDALADQVNETTAAKKEDWDASIAYYRPTDVPLEFLVRRAAMLERLSKLEAVPEPSELSVVTEGAAAVDYANAGDYPRAGDLIHRYFLDVRSTLLARQPGGPSTTLDKSFNVTLFGICLPSRFPQLAGSQILTAVRLRTAALPGGGGAEWTQETTANCASTTELLKTKMP